MSKYFLIALIPMIAAPNYCYTPVTYAVTTYQPYYYQPVIYKEIREIREIVYRDLVTPIAVPVLVPAYQYQFSNPYCTTPNNQNNQQEDIKSMIRQMIKQELQQSQQDSPEPKFNTSQIDQVLNSKCASCHTPPNNKGSYSINQQDAIAKAIEVIKLGRMPPPNQPQVTKQELAILEGK